MENKKSSSDGNAMMILDSQPDANTTNRDLPNRNIDMMREFWRMGRPSRSYLPWQTIKIEYITGYLRPDPRHMDVPDSHSARIYLGMGISPAEYTSLAEVKKTRHC